MKRIYLIFLILFSLTGIKIAHIESVVITPFHFFSIVILLATLFDKNTRLFSRLKYPLFYLVLLILNLLVNMENKLSIGSYAHSIFYILMYCLVLINLRKFTINLCVSATKAIIVIYFIAVVVAFLCVQLHINNNYINMYLGILFDTKTAEYRYYGFSSEPSYMAIIISFCMIFMFRINKIKKVDNINYFFLIYLLTILISTSVYGLVFIFLIIVFEYGYFLKRYKIIFLILFFGFVYFFITTYQTDGRIFQILYAIFSNNNIDSMLTAWNEIDSSSYYRIGPSFWMFNNIEFISLKTFFGHGIDSDIKYFFKFSEGYAGGYLNLGFIPSFIYTNGIVSFILILFYLFSIIKEIKVVYLYFILFIVLFNFNFSTQIFWFITTLVTILSNICFINRKSIYKKQL